MNVHVAITHTGSMPAETCYALPIMLMTARKADIGVEYLTYGHSLIYTARDMAADYVKSNKDIDAILFLDSDMVPPADLIVKLVEADKPIVGALAFKRTPPHEPCIFKTCSDKGSTFYYDYPKDLIEVEGIGMACCLIKREVFDMPKPWYFPSPDLGEDLAFCSRAREHGHSVWCDTRLICGHIASWIVGEQEYLRYKPAIMEKLIVNSKEWWDKEFRENWEVGIDGKEQTRYFMQKIIENIDLEFIGVGILDYGCALGQGVEELKKRYPNCYVEGYDMSSIACDKASSLFPYTFYNSIPRKKYRLVTCSNVLEHFVDPVVELRKILSLSDDFVVILTPYNQTPYDVHPVRITEDTFPEEIDGFLKMKTVIIPDERPELGGGEQILQIYERIGE